VVRAEDVPPEILSVPHRGLSSLFLHIPPRWSLADNAGRREVFGIVVNTVWLPLSCEKLAASEGLGAHRACEARLVEDAPHRPNGSIADRLLTLGTKRAEELQIATSAVWSPLVAEEGLPRDGCLALCASEAFLVEGLVLVINVTPFCYGLCAASTSRSDSQLPMSLAVRFAIDCDVLAIGEGRPAFGACKALSVKGLAESLRHRRTSRNRASTDSTLLGKKRRVTWLTIRSTAMRGHLRVDCQLLVTLLASEALGVAGLPLPIDVLSLKRLPTYGARLGLRLLGVSLAEGLTIHLNKAAIGEGLATGLTSKAASVVALSDGLDELASERFAAARALGGEELQVARLAVWLAFVLGILGLQLLFAPRASEAFLVKATKWGLHRDLAPMGRQAVPTP